MFSVTSLVIISQEYGTFKHHFNKGEIAESAEREVVQNTDWLWKQLDREQVRTAIETLAAYASEERKSRLETVLSMRTRNVRFVYENPANANNTWAALRTLDAFGIQNVDVVLEDSKFSKKCPRRQTMVSAMGAQKWLSLEQHQDSAKCLKGLQKQGYRVVATDVRPDSKPMAEVDWSRTPVAVVFGNELSGISDCVRSIADETFYIPMKGFAESLNVSVAAGVLCSMLELCGALQPGMEKNEADLIMLTWLARSVPGSLDILRRQGFQLQGNSLYRRLGHFTTKP